MYNLLAISVYVPRSTVPTSEPNLGTSVYVSPQNKNPNMGATLNARHPHDYRGYNDIYGNNLTIKKMIDDERLIQGDITSINL